MKKIHLTTNDKFYVPLIKFLEEHFEIEEHFFWFWGGLNEKKLAIPKKKYIYTTVNEKMTLVKLIKLNILLNKSKKIFLHGISNNKYLVLFIIQPWLLKKVNWVILGGDLYSYQQPKITIKQKVYEVMRAFCIKRFGGVITYLKGDYELAKEWYGAKGKCLECIAYPSNLYKELDISQVEKDNNKIYIQIGNSGDPSNNHKEIIDQLIKYKDENIEIICPLSYGDIRYAKEIEKYGKEVFGSKFIALRDFLPFDEYLNLLGRIDIAIFNHRRQQGMGNIITLLGLGKTLYIRNDISTWKLFERFSIKIKPSNEKITLDLLGEKEIRNNANVIKERFSEKKLKKEWENIFNGDVDNEENLHSGL